ncbi:MAG TPA: enoyl-CoA hydratase/isomerase family protein [Sphingobium sp.]
MSDYQTIAIEKADGVDWLLLNRPGQLNAIDPVMIRELNHYCDGVETDLSVRVIVIKGAGRAYCAGLDLNSTIVENANVTDILEGQRSIARIFMKMRRIPQVIVSLVHGPACGGGFAMALASDIRLAGESARMNAAFIRLGLSGCDMGVSYFLPRMIGVSAAAELLLTGDFIGAERALSLGLVSQVVPDEELDAVGARTVQSLLHASPLGLQLTKECLRMNLDAPSLDAAIAMEDRNQTLCVASGEFREGIAAFLEKRPPHYPRPAVA